MDRISPPRLRIPIGTAIAVICGLLCSQGARAQTGGSRPALQADPLPAIQVFDREDASRVLGLEDALDLAMERSYEIYRLQERYRQLACGLESARSALQTHAEFNSVLPSISQGYTNRIWTNLDNQLELALFQDVIGQASTSARLIQPLITGGHLSVGGYLTAYERSMKVGNLETDLRFVMPRLSIDFTQPLFRYNRVRGRLREAELDMESIRLSYGEVEMARAREVTSVFYEVLRQQRLLTIEEEAYRQSLRSRDMVARSYELGLVSEMEKLGLEVTAAQACDRLIRRKQRHLASQLELDRRLGLPLQERIWVEEPRTLSPPRVGSEEALDRALANRSDVRQAEIELEQTRLRLDETVSRGRPDLEFNLSYDYTGNSTLEDYGVETSWSRHLSAGLDPANMGPNSNVNLLLKVPLFDSGQNRADVLRRRSEVQVLEREVQERRTDLEQEVLVGVEALRAATQRLSVQERTRELARQGYEVTRELFEEGEADLSDLLLAQQRYVETESLAIDAQVAYRSALFRLDEITMWDWERDRPLQARTRPDAPGSAEGWELP